MDTSDAKLMSNMRKHAKKCWGDKVVTSADKAKTAIEVYGTIMNGFLNSKSITAAFA